MEDEERNVSEIVKCEVVHYPADSVQAVVDLEDQVINIEPLIGTPDNTHNDITVVSVSQSSPVISNTIIHATGDRNRKRKYEAISQSQGSERNLFEDLPRTCQDKSDRFHSAIAEAFVNDTEQLNRSNTVTQPSESHPVSTTSTSGTHSQSATPNPEIVSFPVYNSMGGAMGYPFSIPTPTYMPFNTSQSMPGSSSMSANDSSLGYGISPHGYPMFIPPYMDPTMAWKYMNGQFNPNNDSDK